MFEPLGVDDGMAGQRRVAHASSVDTLPVVLDRYSELHPEVVVGETDGDWPVRDDLIASFERAAGRALRRVLMGAGTENDQAVLHRFRASEGTDGGGTARGGDVGATSALSSSCTSASRTSWFGVSVPRIQSLRTRRRLVNVGRA